HVYRANVDKPWQAEFAKIAAVSGTSFDDRSVAAGGIHAYRVTALTGASESLPSVQARTQPAGPPPPLVAVLAPAGIGLRWRPPPASDVVGSGVYRGVAQMGAVKRGKRTAWGDNDPEYVEPMPVEVRDIVDLTKVNAEPLTS